jgi:hypothetical protein
VTRTARKHLTCRNCGSAGLILYETRFEHAEYAGGLFVNEQGHLEAAGEGYFTPGDVQPRLTRIECESCGRTWRPRRQFDGISVTEPSRRGSV